MKTFPASILLAILLAVCSGSANHATAAEIVQTEEDLHTIREQFRTTILQDAFNRPPPSPEAIAEAEASLAVQVLREPANTNDGEGGFFVQRLGFHLVWQGMRKARVLHLWGDPAFIVPSRFDQDLELDVPEQWYWDGDYPAALCFDVQGRVCAHPRYTIDWIARKKHLDQIIFEPLRKLLEARLAAAAAPVNP